MKLTSREDKVYMLGKLDVGTQQSFRTFLRVFGNLLEFINGNVYLPTTFIEIIEDATHGHLLLARLDGDGNARFPSQWIHAEYRAQSTEKSNRFLDKRNIFANDVVDDHDSQLLHKIVQILGSENV